MATQTKQPGSQVPKFIVVYLRIIAGITFGLGLSLIFWPSQMVELFFSSGMSDSEFFVRMLGSTLVGYASLNALASYRPVRHSVDVAIWANLITLLLASLISITYVDLFDNLAWLMISQHLVFAAGFFVCVYKLKK